MGVYPMDTRLYNLGESLHLRESDVGEPPHEQMRHIRDQVCRTDHRAKRNPRGYLTSKDKWRAIVDEYGQPLRYQKSECPECRRCGNVRRDAPLPARCRPPSRIVPPASLRCA